MVSCSPTGRRTRVRARRDSPAVPPLDGAKPFLEIDGRPGGYAGLEARYLDRVTLRVLRYDNRADPTRDRQPWRTSSPGTPRFTSAGARLETQGGWTAHRAVARRRDGNRPRAASRSAWPFRSGFGLRLAPARAAHLQCPLRSLLGRRAGLDRRWLAERPRRGPRPTLRGGAHWRVVARVAAA